MREFCTSAWPGWDLQYQSLIFFIEEYGAVWQAQGEYLFGGIGTSIRPGRPIRPDVRLAGHEIWEQACQRTQALLDDYGLAAELMENSVAQVSRYLDRIGAPESSEKHRLLIVAFCRGLRRYAAKLNRLEFVGGSGELASRAFEEGWLGQMNARLELARIVRKLRNEHGAVLMLRAAGYEWEDVGQILGKSAAAIRISFWREIKRIRRTSTSQR